MGLLVLMQRVCFICCACVTPCVWVSPQVYGLSPTSVISAVGTVSGLVCAASMPIFGAIVDYTSKRWELGRGMAIVLFCTNLFQIGLSPSTGINAENCS